MWLSQSHNELEQSKPCQSAMFANKRFGRFLQHSQIARDVYYCETLPRLKRNWEGTRSCCSLRCFGRERGSRVVLDNLISWKVKTFVPLWVSCHLDIFPRCTKHDSAPQNGSVAAFVAQFLTTLRDERPWKSTKPSETNTLKPKCSWTTMASHEKSFKPQKKTSHHIWFRPKLLRPLWLTGDDCILRCILLSRRRFFAVNHLKGWSSARGLCQLSVRTFPFVQELLGGLWWLNPCNGSHIDVTKRSHLFKTPLRKKPQVATLESPVKKQGWCW